MSDTLMRPGLSIDDAFQHILRQDSEYTKQWLPVAYNREDIEGLHQARIGLRRMRSALSIFRRVIPREHLMAMGMEMRWLAHAFTMARDVDVFVTETLQDEEVMKKVECKEGIKKVRAIAEARCARGYEKVRATLDGERYKNFEKNFTDWLENKRWREGMDEAALAKLDRPVETFAQKMMSRRFFRIFSSGAQLGMTSDHELHQVRIRIKKVNYASVFFTPLFNEQGMNAFTAIVKRVQSCLGTINDVAVMNDLIQAILEEEKGVDWDVKKALKEMISLRRKQAKKAKKSLPDCWRDMTALKLPWMPPMPIGDEWD